MLSGLCEKKGVKSVSENARHHRVSFDTVHLRWERHNEFTTYCWCYEPASSEHFAAEATYLTPEMYSLQQPGHHLVSIDLHIVDASSMPDLEAIFAKESLCVMTAEKGAVTVATDFKPDHNGFVKILVVNTDVPAIRIGA